MDRFRWCSFREISDEDGEVVILHRSRIRIYEGEVRTGYENGILQLTNFRLIWTDALEPDTICLTLPLLSIISTKCHSSSRWGTTPKLAISLCSDVAVINSLRSLPRIPNWAHEWLDPSLAQSCRIQTEVSAEQIKFGFVSGSGQREFEQALQEQLTRKSWSTMKVQSVIKGGGIGAIVRAQAAKLSQNDQSISHAFEDLDQLMKSAAEMVKLSKELAKSIRDDKNSDMNADAVEEFRNAMLAMGVEESSKKPGASSTSSDFHIQLAREVCALLLPSIQNASQVTKKRRVQLDWSNSGCIDLTSAYCRVNRARGLEPISPKDLLKAAEAMASLNLPLRLKIFPSGVKVLHLATEDEEKTLQETANAVQENGQLSASEFSRLTSLAPILARERLLMAEERGLLCRDDSYHGLYFFPNRFV